MHADNNRLDKWLQTRLWNVKFSNEKIATVDLIRSVGEFFNIELQGIQLQKLRLRIGRIRDRVDKRYQRYLRLRKRLATEWMVPTVLIDRWHSAGWIDLTPQSLRRLTRLFLERDYTRLVEPEIIPVDPQKDIWN